MTDPRFELELAKMVDTDIDAAEERQHEAENDPR